MNVGHRGGSCGGWEKVILGGEGCRLVLSAGREMGGRVDLYGGGTAPVYKALLY